MERWVCVRKCWFTNRLFRQGDYIEVQDRERDLPWGLDPAKIAACRAEVMAKLDDLGIEYRRKVDTLSALLGKLRQHAGPDDKSNLIEVPKEEVRHFEPAMKISAEGLEQRVDEKAVAMTKLDALGVKYDKRAGLNKLLMMLRAAEGE